MDSPKPAATQDSGGNGPSPSAVTVTAIATCAPSPPPSLPPPPPTAETTSSSSTAAPGPRFPQFSASTAAILERLQGVGGHTSGSAAFEAKRAEMLQNYATSDKLPTPTPPPAKAEPSPALKDAAAARPSASRGGGGGGSGRGRARGAARGRGRGSGKARKRKRSASDDEDEDEDEENDEDGKHGQSEPPSSQTPLPTRTKSGRSVHKPVVFVPTIPEPAHGTKRRKATKTMLAAKCKTCHRETDPSNNRIVFCDACSAAYHQYCHRPPIGHDVVTVLEKEWLCAACVQSRQRLAQGVAGMVSAPALTTDEQKRAYFGTLTHQQLVALLLTATARHPDLPLFPPVSTTLRPPSPCISQPYQPPPSSFHTTLPNMPTTTTPPLPPPPPPLPSQLSHFPESAPPAPPAPPIPPTHTSTATTTIDLAGNQYAEDDGYDTDPPAHYPKPGSGLARTLRPESEDLNWLVDDNFEVFSHGWKGDGTGLGADAGVEAGLGWRRAESGVVE